MDQAMKKEINCLNFKGLLGYLRRHYGEEGVRGGAALENFSKTVFFLARLLGPRRTSARVARLNALFNKTLART
jgi:hypothetical protein